MSAPSIDIQDVRDALATRDVLDAYGWKFRRGGSDELESSQCPQRSDHSRRAFVINSNSGRWRCFPCATSGDLFDFIALTERLSLKSNFPEVLAKAADICGVGPSTLTEDERQARRREYQKKREQLEERERAEKRAREAAAVPKATSYWDRCLRKHSRGTDYLFERGIGDIILVEDAVRFDDYEQGSPAIALYKRTGEIWNVVARRLPELGEPKTPGLKDCPSAGTFINAVNQVESARIVVVTEGVADSITARLAFQTAIILGAHGADNLPKVVKLAAREAVRVNTQLVIVPHRDGHGYRTALEACKIAVEAGLSLRSGSLEILDHGHKDLNDAWRSGWRAA